MAEIQMRESETDEDRMPEVCMACGRPAVTHIHKRFSWHPTWVKVFSIFLLPVVLVCGGIPVAILLLILAKRMDVDVPVCERHRGYWWKRYALVLLPFLLIVAAAVIASAALSDVPGAQKNVPDTILIVAFGVGFVWLIIAAALQTMMIRPKEIADGTITLKNVHEDFVGAFDEIRRQNREKFDHSFDEGVIDYDEKLRRRRERWADRRTGYNDDHGRDD